MALLLPDPCDPHCPADFRVKAREALLGMTDRDCYWLYVVTNCAASPQLREPVRDPASFPWHEVTKVQHYWLNVDAMTKPMRVREERASVMAKGQHDRPIGRTSAKSIGQCAGFHAKCC